MYIIFVVDYSEASAPCGEEFWLDFQFDLLWNVGLFHACPPQLPIVELEDHGVLADVEVDDLLLLVPLLDDLSREVDSLINLNTNLRLNPHLSRLVASPSVQFPITQQGNRIALTRLDLLDSDLLLFLDIPEVFVFCRHPVVFILTITECAILTVTEVVYITLTVGSCVELTACCDTFDLLAFECPDLCGFEAGDVCAMSQRPGWVHEEVHEHASVLSTVSEGINLSILIKDQSVFFATNSILRLDVIFLKILYQLRGINLVLMPQAALSMLIISD